MPCIGVTTNTSNTADHDPVAVMMMGFIRDDDFAFGTAGAPVYVSTTAGHFDFTAPSGSSDFVRIVGYAIDDHLSSVLIYFDPDKTWVEIA